MNYQGFVGHRWQEGKGLHHYKNAKREGMSWYETSKEAMKIVEELYESHRKIPAMIRKGLNEFK